ncbi:MAG: transcriptional repressor [Chloroflexi bacterium]|nr:transcriptional repressor [Chloroflexota bacterium]
MPDLEPFLDDLRQAGRRLTPQREMILTVICESDGHLTAEEILTRARERYPYLNKSAVYRTVELLTRLNLVNQIDFGEGRIEYEIHAHPHHHHLLCRKCGRRTEVDEHVFHSLEKSLLSEYGFEADLDHFAIFGTCKKCKRQLNS